MFIVGCTDISNKDNNQDETNKEEKVSANVIFRALTKEGKHISNVNILVIGSDGKLIENLVTNERGEAEKELTVQVDPKYVRNNAQGIEPRGTVTAIAFKDGYRETVILEVPVSNGSAAQPFYMEHVLPGERDEPIVQLGNNHRLEIISLVEKYVDYKEKK